MKQNCIVIIPIYKYDFNEYELKSIQKTFELSVFYDICAIVPNSYDINKLYQQISNKFDNIYRFNDLYFKDINSYNLLMLNKTFYNKFEKEYKNILIVQDDAYILDTYKLYNIITNNKFNYIGAPIIWPAYIDRFKFFKRGIYYNGGFSLRNIQFCLDCLNNLNYINNLKQHGYLDEDMIFSSYEQEFYNSPTWLDAAWFSLDNQIHLYIPILNFNKPAGIHHWFNDDDNGDNKINLLKELQWI